MCLRLLIRVARMRKGATMNELVISEKNEALALALDSIVVDGKNAMAVKSAFLRTFAMGESLAKLREALTPAIMKSIMSLQNTRLGFKTDNGRGYPLEIVRDCLIEALLYGVCPTGNQFNIISSSAYITKEGFTYLLANLRGLTSLRYKITPAEIAESSTAGTTREGKQYQKIEREGATKVALEWTYNGVDGSEELEFVIKVNAGMGQDAIAGKAERKAKAWLYNHLTGLGLPEADASEASSAPMRDVSPKPSVIAKKQKAWGDEDDIPFGDVVPAPAPTKQVEPVGPYPMDIIDERANKLEYKAAEILGAAKSLNLLTDKDKFITHQSAGIILEHWILVCEEIDKTREGSLL